MLLRRARLYAPWLSTRAFASRALRTERVPDPDLPRFVRRQLLAKEQQSQFHSKHLGETEPTTEKDQDVRLLEPHVLSARLKKLCDAGKVDDAVFMLKNAPLDAQNPPVWNTLIWETLKVKRFQLAYQLYVDMKRRGFSPSTRTFQTLFTGLSKVDNWAAYPKQLSNAHALYEAYRKHTKSIESLDPKDPELSVDPIAPYLRILGSAGCYQEIFDVYYALPKEGPLAPNAFIYTAIFQALNSAKMGSTLLSEKVASDARLLWKQALAASKRGKGFEIDSHIASSAIFALSGGKPMDIELAFSIANQFYGLAIGQTKSVPALIPLQSESFAAVLKLCLYAKQYAYPAQFLQQVKNRPERQGGIGILDRGHMDDILRASISLKEPGLGAYAFETLNWMLRQEVTGTNGPKIRPAPSTYSLVMQACMKAADWGSAVQTFEMMTGLHAHDFMDGSVAERPRQDKRGPGRSITPTAEVVSSLLRAASGTHNRANMRQALRIVNHLGLERLMQSSSVGGSAARSQGFFGTKLATAVVETVNLVLAENSGRYVEESKLFNQLRVAAQKMLDASKGRPSDARKPSRRPAKTFSPSL